MWLSNNDFWSVLKWHFQKQNLSYLSPKEKNTSLTGALKNTFLRKVDKYLKLQYQTNFLKICCTQNVIFDLSKTSILKNNRIWEIWALKKKPPYWRSWKYLLT